MRNSEDPVFELPLSRWRYHFYIEGCLGLVRSYSGGSGGSDKHCGRPRDISRPYNRAGVKPLCGIYFATFWGVASPPMQGKGGTTQVKPDNVEGERGS